MLRTRIAVKSELAFHKGKGEDPMLETPFCAALSQKSKQLRSAQVEGESVANRKEILHRTDRKEVFCRGKLLSRLYL